jgi:hypothetical protein
VEVQWRVEPTRRYRRLGDDEGVPLSVIENGSDSDKLRAIEQLLNRVYGRPTERVGQIPVESKTERTLREMTREQRTAWLIELERRRALRLTSEQTLGRPPPRGWDGQPRTDSKERVTLGRRLSARLRAQA